MNKEINTVMYGNPQTPKYMLLKLLFCEIKYFSALRFLLWNYSYNEKALQVFETAFCIGNLFTLQS